MEIGKIMELKKRIDVFKNNHPKFFGFISAVRAKGLSEGAVMEIKFTAPDGEAIETAIKLSESDIEALRSIGSLLNK